MGGDGEQWRTYEEFAAGIDTYRTPPADLSGQRLEATGADGRRVVVAIEGVESATWTVGDKTLTGPADVVAVRPDVWFIDLPAPGAEGSTTTVLANRRTGQGILVESDIAQTDPGDGHPRVTQRFTAYVEDGREPSGPAPAPSRDLIGRSNLYRYSPEHLYEHVYISSQPQLGRVHDLVTRSVNGGATLVTGGTHEGLFYRPTVLTAAAAQPAFTEEVFGPVAPVASYETAEEAVALASASEYGLSLAIIGPDVLAALELADRIPSGIVHINDQTVDDESTAPFGGVGASGTGSRFGGTTANLDAFTETQWVTMRRTVPAHPF